MILNAISRFIFSLAITLAASFFSENRLAWARGSCIELYELNPRLQQIQNETIANWTFSPKRLSPLPGLSLQIAGKVGYAHLSTSDRQFLERYWINLRLYPPVVIDSITSFQSDSWFCGECLYRFQDHINVAIGRPNRDRRTSIYVENHLVGWIKHDGDNSFLAVRNVMNSNGQLTLVMGGIYSVSKKMMKHLGDEMYSDRVPARSRSIHMGRMEFKPESFLLNDQAFRNEEMMKMFLPNSFWVRLMQNREERHQALWSEILILLDSARRTAESKEETH